MRLSICAAADTIYTGICAGWSSCSSKRWPNTRSLRFGANRSLAFGSATARLRLSAWVFATGSPCTDLRFAHLGRTRTDQYLRNRSAMIPFEDNVGDIIGKAQRGLGISDSELAEKARVGSETIRQMRDGNFDEPALLSIARVLVLSGSALCELPRGKWHPKKLKDSR